MTSVDLPAPTLRAPDPVEVLARLDVDALRRELEAEVDGEVRFDAGSRAAYSTDASNYRQPPIGVVLPRTVEAAVAAVAVCRRHGAPVLSRGGGTSLAGQCTNVAVVLDWSKYCDRLVSLDAPARTCVVEPGIVLDVLNRQLAGHGLEFGPQPATHSRCTLGGMIGNNSCGATAQRTGKVSENIARLEVLLYDGTRMWVGPTSDEEYVDIVRSGGRRAQVYQALRELRDRHEALIRSTFPDIPRRVSGYNLDSLLPENGFDLASALVGSEGTCVTVLRAELKLLPVVPARALVVLGYPDVAGSARDVSRIVPFRPIALEGLDHRLVRFEHDEHRNADALALLPDGPRAWLMVQFGGEDPEQAGALADRFRAEAQGWESGPVVEVFTDGPDQDKIWRVREAGLGATARVPGLADSWPGWEDSAVDPARLGDYLTDLQGLFGQFGYRDRAAIYGHFGQGCVHVRIPFDLRTGTGIAAFRQFLEQAADLVGSYGGSLSGEHGDGQARGELLPRMFGDEVVGAFGVFKAIFDPDDKMNPGKVSAPRRLDQDLRYGTRWEPRRQPTAFAYPDDEGSFGRAVGRCVGVGECRRHDGGVMCPSYMVTGEEEHSTRGRARLLFEMLNGHPDSAIEDGWRSTEVRDALDLCLSCKGCKQDCPVGVDMATYKAEFTYHHYKGRLRPLSHYSIGWLPVALRVGALAPRAVNAVSRAPGLSRLLSVMAGVDRRRPIPVLAPQTLQAWYADRGPRGSGERGEVVLWPDTFSNNLSPEVGRAAVEVLESAGWRVVVPSAPVCCGLTWISTGQLDAARWMLRRTLDVLRPHLRAGTLIVGIEPSCTAVFRSDARELLGDDPDVLRLAESTVTLAELLTEHTPGWEPPSLPRQVIAQTHCHQHAVMGFTADEQLLARMGTDLDVLDSGCCGLAGNFGFERGHYEISQAVGERVLFPAVRAAPVDAVVLADGYSCRTQLAQGPAGGRGGVHLAELLAAALQQNQPPAGTPPEQTYADRVAAPRTRAGVLVVVAAVGAVAAAAAAGSLVRSRSR